MQIIWSRENLIFKMAERVDWIVLLVLAAYLTSVNAETRPKGCPCSDAKLCSPLSIRDRREVLGFVTNNRNWREYNWSSITTLALFTSFDDQEMYDLMCFAHSKRVRVVLAGLGFDVSQLGNASARASWINNYVLQAQKFYLDGINIDFEQPIEKDSNDLSFLTGFVKETYDAFKNRSSDYQVSFDVSWSPDCINGHCYDYTGLASYTDFLVIMAYDERDMVWRQPCIAGPNSAPYATFFGIKEYIRLGIPSEKLVLGLPWYGYDYTCLTLSTDNVCQIKPVSRVGAPCSDAGSSQVNYCDIVEKFLPNSTSGRVYNTSSQSPYFNYRASDGSMHQIWYDDPQSLKVKYHLAASQDMKGVAMWNIDCLDYASNDATHEMQTQEMWDAIGAFLI